MGLREDVSRSAAKRSATTSRSIAELLLNDIKGIEAPSLDAWSTAAALAAVTERLELMVAVRPSFHPPAILAKQAANIDRISNGRLALNVVSAWWKDEARRYGAAFDEHDDRYARTKEWLDVVDGAWSKPKFSYHGKFYNHDDIVLEPKPVARAGRPRPTIYAGGESDAAKTTDLASVRRVRHARRSAGTDRAEDRRHARTSRARVGGAGCRPSADAVRCRGVHDRPRPRAEVKEEIDRITNVTAGSPGYGNYRDWIANTKLEQQVSLQDYSVSNRGLRAGLVGTADQVAERVVAVRGGRASIYCCCSAARSSRRWSVSREM